MLTKIFYTVVGILASFFALILAMKTKINLIAWFEIASSIMLAWYFKKQKSLKTTKWRYALNGLMWGNIIILILSLIMIILLSLILGRALN